MKHTIHIILILLLMAFAGILSTERMYGEGIRVVPQSAIVRGDSLHLTVEMDLNSVQVNSYTAVTFTPLLERGKTIVELPPVIITGKRRYGFERRERALQASRRPLVTPYLVLLDGRRAGSKNIRYEVSVPFALWMQGASLVLRKEVKDCCDTQLLGVDTLTRALALNRAAVSARSFAAAPIAVASEVEATGRVVIPAVVPAVTQTVTPGYVAIESPSAPRPVRAAAPSVPQTVYVPSTGYALDYASMVSYLQPQADAKKKQHLESAILYIDYPLGKDDVYPDYKNNSREIDKADALLHPLLSNGFSELRNLRIRGYSSPDGDYRNNERLASARSRLFADYVQGAYNIPRRLFDVSSVAEDWDGLSDLLEREQPPYYRQALGVISRYGIFSGREKYLMELQGGLPYKDMLRHFFPRLRRIEIVVEYDVRSVDAGEASELIYTHPGLLSLAEMYQVARHYRPGTDQYREIYEIAAFHFPNDVVANVNAAAAVMLTGDLVSAWDYLRKAEADPRAWNNMGVLTLMEGNREGAAAWFRKAVGVEPQKARTNLQMCR